MNNQMNTKKIEDIMIIVCLLFLVVGGIITLLTGTPFVFLFLLIFMFFLGILLNIIREGGNT